jgi:hypothetical protein
MKNILVVFIVTCMVVIGLTAYNIHGSNKRREFAASQASDDISFSVEGSWDRQLVVVADPTYDDQTLADLMTRDSFFTAQLHAEGFTTVRVGKIVETIQ